MKADWTEARNILCIRLDTMGDVLMTSPAIRALKESLPDRHITLLTSANGADIARSIPVIDEVIEYNAPWMKTTPERSDSRHESAMASLLKELLFDGAVIFTSFSQSPLPAASMCWNADIPLRLAHCHENPYQLLTHWIPDPEPALTVRHEVRRQLDLVSMVGATASDTHLSLRIDKDTKEKIAGRLDDLGMDRSEPWVLFHPGATAPSRRYPADQYAEAARALTTDAGVQVLFTGSPEERSLVEYIRGKMEVPSWSLAGEIGLSELCGLVSLSPLLVVNNTGPAHIAAAVGTPVVDLYALTNPQHAPWQVRSRVLYHDVPCRFCFKSICPERHHNCLRLVTPTEVVHAAMEILKG